MKSTDFVISKKKLIFIDFLNEFEKKFRHSAASRDFMAVQIKILSA
jgi:hypothetical protein